MTLTQGLRTKATAVVGRSAKTMLSGALLILGGCGDRSAAWDTPFVRGDTVGLAGSVAVIDSNRNELMMLTTNSDQELGVTRLKVGKNVVATKPSDDLERLFVLTRGEQRRLHENDEPPQLFVIGGGTSPKIDEVYPLSDPAQKLTLDPKGEWAIVQAAEGVIVNVNELILVDLLNSKQHTKTIRTNGSTVQRFTFTSELPLPNGEERRLLVAETDQDIVVIDLADEALGDITVPLPKTSSSMVAHPAQVVFSAGSAENETPSYLAVRFDNDSSVLTLRLADPGENSHHAFSLSSNLVDAGARPNTIEFVQTDRGLRLAALVASKNAAILFDPATSKSENVQFDHPYSGIARVTGLVADSSSSADVALLYSETAPNIAFWRLGAASATPYASFDSYQVDARVKSVVDVPGDEFGYLKLMFAVDDKEFFLLDLKSRLSYPMQALSGFNLRLSPDGRRAWAFPSSGQDFAELTLESMHPASFAVELPIKNLFDIKNADQGRSLLVLHSGSGASDDLGVTLFDAELPDSAKTRFVGGLSLEGWR